MKTLRSPSLTLPLTSQRDDGSGDLRIKNVQIWHEGRYTCTAQTVVDSDTAYADLKVVGQYCHGKYCSLWKTKLAS